MKKILLTLLCLVSISILQAEEYTYTFTSRQFSANGTKTLDGIDWTIAGDGGYWGYDSNNGKGQQFGSKSLPYKSLALSTSGFVGKTISEIKINTSGANNINATMSVTVDGTTFEPASIKLTNTATDYTFTGSASGDVIFTWTQTSSVAIYVKSITITYESTGAEVVDKPKFSVGDGVIYGEKTVQISSDTEDAVISYSIDGGDFIQGTSFLVNQSMTVEAKAEKEGCETTTSQVSYTFAECAYDKMNVENIVPGTYVIASYYNDKFYLMKNELVSTYYPGGTESDLSENTQIDATNLFIITGEKETGYQIQNKGYVTLLESGSYTNVKIEQESSDKTWSFSETENGAIKATYGDVAKFLSFTTSFKNFTTDTDVNTCPVFYRINDNIATGVEEIATENAPVEYYNLQGVKVANPENGLFIKKQGAKTTKVIL